MSDFFNLVFPAYYINFISITPVKTYIHFLLINIPLKFINSYSASCTKSRCSASASAIRPSALPPEPKSWSGPASCTARHPKSCTTARGFSQASRTPCAWGATIRWSSVPTWTRRTPNSRSRRTVPKAKSWPSAIRIARGWASSSIRNRS